MSESNEQVSDVIGEDKISDSIQTDGPAPCDEIQEVNKLETDEDDGVTEDVNNTDSPENDSTVTGDAIPSSPARIKRNVSFPGNGPPVLGYMDPPDPWRNVPPWTSQDLVAAYRKCCEKYSIRPLHKVIQQIQAVENVGQRYETLSLKGEKLDIRHCECLEEILRRVQFRTIDLEACHLDDETAVALFDMVEYYESACKVNISFNKNISFRGWQSCARLIRKTPCLTHLDARNCEINERVMPIMGRSLRMGCFLTTLHLENTNLSGRPLIILVAALKMNEILKELFLADNKLFPTDGIQLGNLLKYNHKLELLDIRNNHLQDIGVGHVCDGVYEQNLGTGLLTLVLWNNQLSYQSMSAISRALTSAESLETLNLGHNNVTNEGIHLLKEGLLKTKSLLRVGLQGTKITCEGAVALAEAIADSPRLLRLDLRENDIKTAGLMALALALKVNETVVRLDLDKDTKRESGMRDYADQQRRLQQDISNYLDRNLQISRKKEEEERIKLEQKWKEEQEKASSEGSDIEKDVKFICGFDKIKRPGLLVMSEHPAEQDLDSPCCTSENFTDFSVSNISSVVHSSNLLQNMPPAELLLSPQYCPAVKARKLFTVSKVLSPSSPISSGGKPLGDLPTSPLTFQPATLVNPNVESVVSQTGSELAQLSVYNSSDLAEVLAAENVNNLIQNMMVANVCVNESNTTKLGSITEKSEDSDWSEKITNNQSDSSNMSVGTDSSKKDQVSSADKSSVSTCKKDVAVDDSDLEKDPVPDIIEDSDDVFDENLQFEQTQNDLTAEKNDKNNLIEDSAIEKSKENKAKHIHYYGSDAGNGDNGENCSDDSSTKTDKDIITTHSIGNNISENVKCSKPKESDTSQKDSGIGSYENEHWTKIESTECSVVSGADKTKPNFHTTLTMNGLTQELASVLENLDGETTTTTTASASAESEILTPPDEFERELDQLLANVKMGSNIPSTTETSLNISNSLNKTPEEILQEALESSGSTSIPEALESSGSTSIPVKQ